MRTKTGLQRREIENNRFAAKTDARARVVATVTECGARDHPELIRGLEIGSIPTRPNVAEKGA